MIHFYGTQTLIFTQIEPKLRKYRMLSIDIAISVHIFYKIKLFERKKSYE